MSDDGCLYPKWCGGVDLCANCHVDGANNFTPDVVAAYERQDAKDATERARKEPMFTRAEFFWLTYLWLLDQERIRLTIEFTLLLDKVYGDLGSALGRLTLRSSPIMSKLRGPT